MRHLEHFVPPRDATALVLVDFQERLFAAMEPERKEAVLENTKLLLQLAKTMEMPVLVTEQYPKGLGKTIPQVVEVLPPGVEAVLLTSETAPEAISAHVATCRPGGVQLVDHAAMDAHGRLRALP